MSAGGPGSARRASGTSPTARSSPARSRRASRARSASRSPRSFEGARPTTSAFGSRAARSSRRPQAGAGLPPRDGRDGRRGEAGRRVRLRPQRVVTEYTGNLLLDEKIGGTVHLALGRSVPGTGGTNHSALHWDMVCDLRDGGEVYADGELVYRDGAFLDGVSLTLVAVISDTHMPRGTRRLPKECLRRLAESDLILHVGDFVSVAVLEELRELAPVDGVFGNMDEPELRLVLPRTPGGRARRHANRDRPRRRAGGRSGRTARRRDFRAATRWSTATRTSPRRRGSGRRGSSTPAARPSAARRRTTE